VSFPDPKPGLVIRYEFLWSNEADHGAAEGSKERPCAIVVAAYDRDGAIRTIVAPVTHAPPSADAEEASLEIPAKLCRSLGLDAARHWIRLDELNRFIWPGYDLRPRPDAPDRWEYGMLPKAFYEEMRVRILDLDRRRRNRVVTRD
jgi:hypothetical protein